MCDNYPCSCYTQPDSPCAICGSWSCDGECQNICSNCGSRYCNGNCGGSSGGNSGGSGGNTGLPQNLSHLHGDPDYYNERHMDAENRLGEGKGPTYYKEYGDKYYNNFMNLKKDLSDSGKEWVDNTALLLHESITDILINNPDIEKDSEAFENMAFNSHTQAYIEGGLFNITLSDKFCVLVVVLSSPADAWKGRHQIIEVGGRQLKYWYDNPTKAKNEALQFVSTINEIRRKVLVSLPPYILTKSSASQYTDSEIDSIIHEVYWQQIEYFEANVPGFVSPI